MIIDIETFENGNREVIVRQRGHEYRCLFAWISPEGKLGHCMEQASSNIISQLSLIKNGDYNRLLSAMQPSIRTSSS